MRIQIGCVLSEQKASNVLVCFQTMGQKNWNTHLALSIQHWYRITENFELVIKIILSAVLN